MDPFLQDLLLAFRSSARRPLLGIVVAVSLAIGIGGWEVFGGGERRVGNSRRASGGAGGSERSGTPALIEVVLREGLGLGGIELRALVEVVGGESLGDLV